MQIYLAQVNPKIGDLKGNFEIMQRVIQENPEANLIVFPELFLSGFPPRDLCKNNDFIACLEETLEEIQNFTSTIPDTAIFFGTPWPAFGKLFNAALMLKDGNILGVQAKRKLTQFRDFDEHDYFSQANTGLFVDLAGKKIGLSLGLELDQELGEESQTAKADLLINLSAIPYEFGDGDKRIKAYKDLAKAVEIPIISVCQVGGNDGLIFAGGSFVLDQSGNLTAKLPEFNEAGLLVDLNQATNDFREEPLDEVARLHDALVLGLRDYVYKSGMKSVVIGLSGGLDSAVAAALAVEALGLGAVWGITQPGPFSPPSSVEDASALAENLGIKFDILPINKLYEATLGSLADLFRGTPIDVAEENIQARLRGNQLMAVSNKFGGLVLTNSNKSELAVGYCTLYGDMSGGLAVLADCYKTQVYKLAHYINREEEVIPLNTIEKPPSAELRPNQRDDESLPPYEILDEIISLYLDQGVSVSELIERGFAEEIVRWTTRIIDNNDYKRRQAALILRATTPILGRDRDMPLAACKSFF